MKKEQEFDERAMTGAYEVIGEHLVFELGSESKKLSGASTSEICIKKLRRLKAVCVESSECIRNEIEDIVGRNESRTGCREVRRSLIAAKKDER